MARWPIWAMQLVVPSRSLSLPYGSGRMNNDDRHRLPFSFARLRAERRDYTLHATHSPATPSPLSLILDCSLADERPRGAIRWMYKEHVRPLASSSPSSDAGCFIYLIYFMLCFPSLPRLSLILQSAPITCYLVCLHHRNPHIDSVLHAYSSPTLSPLSLTPTARSRPPSLLRFSLGSLLTSCWSFFFSPLLSPFFFRSSTYMHCCFKYPCLLFPELSFLCTNRRYFLSHTTHSWPRLES